ncbi:hypothetical protein D9619_002306 [Psilocybe cf. subviscida]|uniref:DUF6593 domain-containing protein n=1 Tax=Psilocybe cf. subviscida TaxID=2480587 RepID=A0A8H5AW55_9AGAR|nr:hypothetical protein D9619_002306 [Psilocybe cf. subviscida]
MLMSERAPTRLPSYGSSQRWAGANLHTTVLVQGPSHSEIIYPIPTRNVEFTFSPVGPNSMLLLPQADEGDAHPRYYITVMPSCFMPLSHITTIYRGANENAPRVGEFEMGITSVASERQIGTRPPEPLAAVLKKVGIFNGNRWRWSRNVGPNLAYSYLFWECNAAPFTCFTEDEQKKPGKAVAWFTPQRAANRTGASARLSHLEVTPQGQMLFDDIIMSILTIERKLLQPPEPKFLFNFH